MNRKESCSHGPEHRWVSSSGGGSYCKICRSQKRAAARERKRAGKQKRFPNPYAAEYADGLKVARRLYFERRLKIDEGMTAFRAREASFTEHEKYRRAFQIISEYARN